MTEPTPNPDPPITPNPVAPPPDPSPPEPAKPPIAADPGGGDPPPEPKPYWPDDWRTKAAEHYAAGDKKAYEKELKRLERVTDPAAAWGMYREAESKLSEGGRVKLPGKDAKPEEVQEFYKALGVPEKPEGYFETLKLENGAELGDDDKPILTDFAAKLHEVGATPAVVNAAANWYYANQQKQADALDEQDDKVRTETENVLKEELGSAYKRSINNISTLFATAPGGTDLKNDGGLFTRLLGGRMADGKQIGNDPDMLRFLISLSREFNPLGAVVEDASGGGKSAEAELADLQKLRSTDRRKYYSADVQSREQELIAAIEKTKAKG